MANSEPDKSEMQEQGPKKGIVIIVISILLGTNGLLLWQFFEKKNNLDIANQTIVTTNAEKDALQAQLNQIKVEYEKMKAENTSLQSELTAKEEEIKAKMQEIQRLIAIGGPAQIAKAKAELAQLREMNAIYIARIDSLNSINVLLKTENKDLTSNLSDEKSKNQNLTFENTRLAGKVAAGSVLKALSIVSEGLRYKSNGKEMITSKAKQVQQLRTRFVLGENKVVDQGPTDIYIRVAGPDGGIVSSEQSTFMVNGQPMIYTYKQIVDYTNNDLPVTVNWAKGTEFTKGKYVVEIYHLGNVIGKSMIELK